MANEDLFETRFSRPSSADQDTVYHLIPNPDAESFDFSDGAQLHWECAPDWKANGHFYIPAEDLRAIAAMFSAAADIAERKRSRP